LPAGGVGRDISFIPPAWRVTCLGCRWLWACV